ncbi:MAG: chemotaxis protein CheW [Magnetococcales bacterium]|nr:chemotaxis protein CheW [Magnetococcales bacterium]
MQTGSSRYFRCLYPSQGLRLAGYPDHWLMMRHPEHDDTMNIASENKMVFSVDDQLFAVGVDEVERVYRAMQITVLPEAPELLLGLANLGGRILPVVDLRSRLELPGRPIDPDDRLVLLAGKIAFCFFVDRVLGVVAFDQEVTLEAKYIYPKLDKYISGVGKHDNRTVLFIRMGNCPGTASVITQNGGVGSRYWDPA